MTQLSPHFSLTEFTVTSKPYPNIPTGVILSNLTKTAQGMEAVRSLLGNPITVNSAYRSPLVNAAVGSKPTSAHMIGWAVDFVCPKFGSAYDVAKAIEASSIKYDQIIYEQTWVHISFDPRMRGQKLTYRGGKYTNGITK